MNPYSQPAVRLQLRAFLDRYFADNAPRVLVLGINPGRFGAGITGVTFTDPVALADFCGIPNPLPRRRELSSVFVYEVIEAFGGPERFYHAFFLTAVSPLGFTKGGRNLNYYDLPALRRAATPFILESLRAQIAMGGRTDHAIVLGQGTNATFLRRLNEEHGLFANIHALEHPRFILQYRRRRAHEFVARYLSVLRTILADGSPNSGHGTGRSD